MPYLGTINVANYPWKPAMFWGGDETWHSGGGVPGTVPVEFSWRQWGDDSWFQSCSIIITARSCRLWRGMSKTLDKCVSLTKWPVHLEGEREQPDPYGDYNPQIPSPGMILQVCQPIKPTSTGRFSSGDKASITFSRGLFVQPLFDFWCQMSKKNTTRIPSRKT